MNGVEMAVFTVGVLMGYFVAVLFYVWKDLKVFLNNER